MKTFTVGTALLATLPATLALPARRQAAQSYYPMVLRETGSLEFLRVTAVDGTLGVMLNPTNSTTGLPPTLSLTGGRLDISSTEPEHVYVNADSGELGYTSAGEDAPAGALLDGFSVQTSNSSIVSQSLLMYKGDPGSFAVCGSSLAVELEGAATDCDGVQIVLSSYGV